MQQRPVFLTAEWRKLAIANYAIDPDILKPFVPPHTELDLFQGNCYVSLVGFMFLNTRLKGIKVPFHVNFEEVNLRFYVRFFENGAWKRGVVFIREIVPKPALSLVANTFFGEHYRTHRMFHRWNSEGDLLEVEYGWKQQGQTFRFMVKAGTEAEEMPEGSEAEFITEHYWGYAKRGGSSGYTSEYAVEHPRWKVYPVREFTIDVDFEVAYGAPFGILNHLDPVSVMLAEGSETLVRSGQNIGK